jgi:Holliday junction resolvasome RuvABC ATP-dependent DNA helicase subunit
MTNKFLEKLKDNIRFAMDIDDKIPEHIVKEIKAELEAREVGVGGETVQEFNEQVGKKLRLAPNLKPIIKTAFEEVAELAPTLEGIVEQAELETEPEEKFFDEIVGYVDIKKIMLKCINSSDREPIHVILDGPPASAKSLFLLQMGKKLENSYYADCTNTTGPGIVKYLFEHDVKYLFLDEVEKMNKTEQNVLLNVMETGILTSTKVKQTRSKKMNLSIYATTNDIDAISKPFRSRFMEFSLPEYSYEDFKEIAIKLLNMRYGHDEELSLTIADTIWNKIGSKDVRDMLQVGK